MRLTYFHTNRLLTELYKQETEICCRKDDGFIKKWTDINRHGQVQPSNICRLLDPPHFSLVTTFKGLSHAWGGLVYTEEGLRMVQLFYGLRWVNLVTLKVVGNEKGGGVKKQATVRIWFRTVAIDVCLIFNVVVVFSTTNFRFLFVNLS